MLPPLASRRYVDVRTLAKGGMGVALRAHDTRMGRDVVIKLIREDLLADPKVRRRFEREVQNLARVDHPNVVRVYDFAQEDGVAYYTMEYFPGESLAERIERALPPVPLAVEMAALLAGALEAIHGRQIVHRDIKPANIVVTADGVPKLIDFGLAKRMGEAARTALTRIGDVVGTLRYLPPEVLLDKEHTEKGDIYQLGVVLYEALTGRVPVSGEALYAASRGGRSLSLEPPSASRREVDGEIDRIVMTALAFDPEARFGSAAAMRGRLEAWLAGGIGPREAPLPSRAAETMSLAPVSPERPVATEAGGALRADALPAPPDTTAALPLALSVFLRPAVTFDALAAAERSYGAALWIAGAAFFGGPVLASVLHAALGMPTLGRIAITWIAASMTQDLVLVWLPLSLAAWRAGLDRPMRDSFIVLALSWTSFALVVVSPLAVVSLLHRPWLIYHGLRRLLGLRGVLLALCFLYFSLLSLLNVIFAFAAP